MLLFKLCQLAKGGLFVAQQQAAMYRNSRSEVDKFNFEALNVKNPQDLPSCVDPANKEVFFAIFTAKSLPERAGGSLGGCSLPVQLLKLQSRIPFSFCISYCLNLQHRL